MFNFLSTKFINSFIVLADANATHNETVFDLLFNKFGILFFFLPEILLITFVLVLLCVYVFNLHKSDSVSYIKKYILAIIGFFVVLFFLYIDLFFYYSFLISENIEVNNSFFSSQLIINSYSFGLKLLTILFAIIFFVISYSVIKYYWFIQVEHLLLMCLSIFGSLLLASSNDLLVFYLTLEISTIPLYILVASKLRCNFSTEAGLKYFIMGSFSSGLILFGFSYIYGFTGLTSFSDLYVFFQFIDYASMDFFILLGLVLFVSGLFIKIGVAPFHLWVVDVYSGAPILITLFMLTIPKVILWGISYNLIVNVFYCFFNSYISYLLVAMVISSFLFGIFPGLYQIKIKRLIIYSGIASNGFFLMPFFTASSSSLFVYLTIYIITTFGFFSFYFLLRNRSNLKLIKKISELNNYYANNALLAYCGSFLLFSMAGIPPFAGFLAKFYLYINTYSVVPSLVAISLLFGCVSTFYYIRLSKWMFFSNSLVPSAKNTWLFLIKPDNILVSITVISVLFNLTLILFFNSYIDLINSLF